MKGKFTPERRRAILLSLSEGLTQIEAAQNAQVTPRSLKTWISKGRKEPDGPYGDFAMAVDAVTNATRLREGDLTPDEHRELVAGRCRSGSDTALRLYWEMILDDRSAGEEEDQPDEDSFEAFDELAERRKAAAP